MADDDVKVAEGEQNNSLIKQAEAVVERMEKANAEAKEILIRQEELAMQNLLGGKSDAGQEPIKPKEETPAEYSARILRGGK